MNKSILTNKLFISAVALFCCALWGISTPIVKLGYNYIDAEKIPVLIFWVGIQFFISGLITVLFYSLISKKFLFPKKENIKGVLVISFLQTVLQYVFLYIGLLYTTAVKGSVLKSTDVFFIMLISCLIFRQEKLTFSKIFCCVAGFSGIVIVNLKGLSLNINPLGDGLVLLAIFIYSFAVVITKRYTQNVDPIMFCGYQMAIGGAVMLLIGAMLGGAFNFFKMLPIIVILSAIYAVSYSLWTMLLKHNQVSRVSIHSFTVPIFGVIFSALLLEEQGNVPIVNLLVAIVLISVGIIVWNKNQKV